MPDPSKRRASDAACRAVAEAIDALGRASDNPDGTPQPEMERLMRAKHDALVAYRREIAPLRTRAEVDSHIARVVRGWFENSGRHPVGLAEGTFQSLCVLCREETAPAPEPTPNHTDVIRHPCHCGASFPTAEELELHQGECPQITREPLQDPDERPCGCEEAEALKARIERILNAVIIIGGSVVKVRALIGEVP